ncbi:TolC family outer membrane protein [Methylobacter sp. BlB1]|uniref:TolC family outer membrane protein n=1 Tax=Methylobacter sp. BlB1 TaxID=2785914 RepID=UPI001894428D|nr:TolC family outer membrane protein [Methylobacter sp. BlB1]MBF6651007.1 TolC family outer membrane protein [Methylobacter sp. BlB1]
MIAQKIVYRLMPPIFRSGGLVLLVLLGWNSCPILAAELPPSNLLDIYNKAIEEDPQLMKGKAIRQVSEEQRNQAKAKALLPTVNLSANVTGNHQHIRLNDPQAIGVGGEDLFMSDGYDITLYQPVFHYDRLIAMDQAGQRVEQSEMELNATHQDLILRVAERYFGLLGAFDNLRYSEAQKDTLGRQREQTQQRFNYGEIAITDVSESNAGYDRAVADEIEAQQQLNDARAALREITGEYYDSLSALAEDIPLVKPEPLNEKNWTDQALAQNPRIVAATLASNIARDEISRLDSAHLPTLDFKASNGWMQTGGQFGDTTIFYNSFGLEMNMSLYEGGQMTSRSREAAHRHDETLATLKQEQRSAERQSRDAFYGVVTGVSRVQALRQTLKSQELSMREIESGIQVGSRTTLDLVVATREWYRVQRDYAKARYDYLLNTLRLKRSAGILEYEDLAKINTFLTDSASAAQP